MKKLSRYFLSMFCILTSAPSFSESTSAPNLFEDNPQQLGSSSMVSAEKKMTKMIKEENKNPYSPTALRSRIVELDMAMIQKKPNKITFNLFSDVVLEISKDTFYETASKEQLAASNKPTKTSEFGFIWDGYLDSAHSQINFENLNETDVIPNTGISVRKFKKNILGVSLHVTQWNESKQDGTVMMSDHRNPKGWVSEIVDDEPVDPQVKSYGKGFNLFYTVSASLSIKETQRRYVITSVPDNPRFHVVSEYDMSEIVKYIDDSVLPKTGPLADRIAETNKKIDAETKKQDAAWERKQSQ